MIPKMQTLVAVGDSRTARHILLLAMDTLVVGGSLALALMLRMNGAIGDRMTAGLFDALPFAFVVSAIVFEIMGLYRRAWRFVSLRDLIHLIEAATASIVLTFFTLFLVGDTGWLPTSVPIIQWFITVVLLSSLRVFYRRLGEWRSSLRATAPARAPTARRRALIVGPVAHAELVLRQLEADADAGFVAVGILEDSGSNVRLNVRGVPILGTIESLDYAVAELAAAGRRPECIILGGDPGCIAGPGMVRLASKAAVLGLSVSRAALPGHVDGADPDTLELQPINLSSLLDRDPTAIDQALISRVVTGRRVLVTGAGGTIGRELVRQIAAMKPGHLLLLDAGEFNLYSVDLELQESHSDVPRTPILCSIRQREAVMEVFETHRPELVFHAAALKHVPLVEMNVCAGVQTNVLGTRNVADAARRFKATAMVQVSTDKAVNPVGLMGATKRLGELYCQALDLEGRTVPGSPRFLTVRFGNVLGSSGSLIPLFQRQLARRGPLTVTHPEIRRYFMTVFEAVQLILQSAARGLEEEICRGKIFVLNMGEPIRIMDIARRMIRLSGLEPDRDIRIDVTGLRPGEKLYEELFDTNEKRLESSVPGMFEAEPNPIPCEDLTRIFDELERLTVKVDHEGARRLIFGVLERQSERVPIDASIIAPPAAPAPARIGMKVQIA